MQMDQKQIRKTFSRVGLGITVWYLITIVLATVIQMTLYLVAPQAAESGWAGWLSSYIPMYCVGMPVMLFIFKTVPSFTGGPLERKPLSLLGLLAAAAACWFIVVSVNTLMLYLAALIEALLGGGVTNALAEQASNANPWLNFVIVGIVAPVFEEFVFRKKLYDKLIVFGGKAYILVSAMAFSLFHANFYQLGYAFLLGLVFGTIMYKTGKLVYSIAAHMLINMLGAAGSGLFLAYASELVQSIWFVLVYAVAAIGLVAIIWWLVKKRNSIGFAPAEVPLPSKGIVFGNPGMILMIVMFLLFTFINSFASIFI